MPKRRSVYRHARARVSDALSWYVGTKDRLYTNPRFYEWRARATWWFGGIAIVAGWDKLVRVVFLVSIATQAWTDISTARTLRVNDE